MQEASSDSGDYPEHLESFCTAVTVSPDYGSFHITMYGGWSLNDGRSYETVYILSIPSFVWIDVTDLSNKTNAEQQVNETIGRNSPSCQTYNGAQMMVLGGQIRAGAYDLTDQACSQVLAPVRALDLSTYHWQTSFDPSITYQVPPAIYKIIGGK